MPKRIIRTFWRRSGKRKRNPVFSPKNQRQRTKTKSQEGPHDGRAMEIASDRAFDRQHFRGRGRCARQILAADGHGVGSGPRWEGGTGSGGQDPVFMLLKPG